MLWTSRLRFPFLALLAVLFAASFAGCEYFSVEEDEEAKILEPPSVREIIDDADELGLRPRNLLQRRRAAAVEDLEDLYQERMDDARGDRAIERLERQLERQTDRLHRNYDVRLERLEDRLDREAERDG